MKLITGNRDSIRTSRARVHGVRLTIDDVRPGSQLISFCQEFTPSPTLALARVQSRNSVAPACPAGVRGWPRPLCNGIDQARSNPQSVAHKVLLAAIGKFVPPERTYMDNQSRRHPCHPCLETSGPSETIDSLRVVVKHPVVFAACLDCEESGGNDSMMVIWSSGPREDGRNSEFSRPRGIDGWSNPGNRRKLSPELVRNDADSGGRWWPSITRRHIA